MTSSCDVAVIGGGIIGRAVAFELARRRMGRIAIADHGGLGGEASPAAAGFLPVASMRAPRGVLFDLGRASLALYPDFLAAVSEASGARVELEHPGCLQLADTAEQALALRERVARRGSQGLAAEFLEAPSLRAQLPASTGRFAAGALFPHESQVDAGALLTALSRACEVMGVKRLAGRAVLGPSCAPDALRFEMGDEQVTAGCLVLAAGWWSSELAGRLGATLPVRPVRGEMIEVLAGGAPPRCIIDHGVLLLPRRAGRLWIGGLMEFDSSPEPSAKGRGELLERASRLWPEAGRAKVLAHWAGVRPCSDIRHPIVDRVPGWENVYVATGHHRSGFLLAPVTSRVVAARILGEDLPVEDRAVRWG